jgi:CheY-like chemotaxis protein
VLDLNGTVAEIEKMLYRLIGDHIELETVPAPEKVCVKADRGQIEQVLVNLAVNSRDAMPNGGKLTIAISNETVSERDKTNVPAGDYVLLRIQDTGTGMTAEVRERIFEPFFTTKEEGRGTGLGLATCYGIVKQSGGRILCKSEPGVGTVFSIYLPAVAESPDLLMRHEPAAPLPRGTETILVVEDLASVRGLATRVLRSLGYHVLEAENGERALGIIEECGLRKIDLVVTDVMMPQMGGKELVERFRAQRPDTKVLFNSGSIEDKSGLNEMLLQKANTAFLTKPFTPTELARKVREVLDARG